MAKKKLLVLATLFLIACVVGWDTQPQGPAPDSRTLSGRLARAGVGGVVVALLPIGAMAGCGGGGGGPTRPTSATAVALTP
jgi:hypothetical protein